MTVISELLRHQTANAMSPQTIALNRRYLQGITRRELRHADHVAGWHGQIVDVFLRHESNHVFAIAGTDQIGMADYVLLNTASFHVDEFGRQQACHGEGELPNGRNVHAWVRGTLVHAGMQAPLATRHNWAQIIYHPKRMSAFQFVDSGQTVHSVPAVACTPAPAQVWAVPDSQLFHAEASA